MIDFLIALAVSTVGVACLMEMLKATVNGIRAAVIRKKVGYGAEKDFPVPSFVWWVSAGLLSIGAAILVQKSVLGSEEPVTALLSIFASGWFLGIWIPIVWWVQMQLDMQVIKKYAVPILKKVLAKKLEVDDD
jgi:hypothetical protein